MFHYDADGINQTSLVADVKHLVGELMNMRIHETWRRESWKGYKQFSPQNEYFLDKIELIFPYGNRMREGYHKLKQRTF